MAYGFPLLRKMGEWVDDGRIPQLSNLAVVELGAQMINCDTPHEEVAALIRRFKPGFDTAGLAKRFPEKPPYYYSYFADIWHLCGVRYFSYDVVEGAPDCRMFDLNFHEVPASDRGCAGFVTNSGTTEHVANQINAFSVIHDLLAVGGVALHQVPFAGYLNHCLFNYHPKFFVSLIVNNRYRLRHVNFNGPAFHKQFGENHNVFDSDYLPESGLWSGTALPSGTIDLLIEKRFDAPFVPPVDFAHGYFDAPRSNDLRELLNQDVPESNWANAYRRRQTPSQITTLPDEEKKRKAELNSG